MSAIFGYTFDEISAAQQKRGRLGHAIDTTKPAADDMHRLEADRALLSEHGADGLRERGFFGVLDRLTRAGLIA